MKRDEGRKAMGMSRLPQGQKAFEESPSSHWDQPPAYPLHRGRRGGSGAADPAGISRGASKAGGIQAGQTPLAGSHTLRLASTLGRLAQVSIRISTTCSYLPRSERNCSWRWEAGRLQGQAFECFAGPPPTVWISTVCPGRRRNWPRLRSALPCKLGFLVFSISNI